MKLHFVIARHVEDLTWLWDILIENKDWEATIYNDGPMFLILRYFQEELLSRIHIFKGDNVPCEPTKYIRFIIDNYENETTQKIVFLQGNPLYHNPTLLDVLKNVAEWNCTYQNLTLFPHPPPWGCADAILNGEAPGAQKFTHGGMVWSDPDMDNEFQGSYHKDGFVNELRNQANGVTVQDLCSLFGVTFDKGTNIKRVQKTYAAMFSTNWETLVKLSLDQWQNIHTFMIHGDNMFTKNMSQKGRACLLEYMWPIFCLQ